MKYFFVTGLARTRTAWLANLLTYGKSFCGHDVLHQCTRLAEVPARVSLPGNEWAGVSDCGLVGFYAEMETLCPGARWVVVHRDEEAAAKSIYHWQRRGLYRGQDKPLDWAEVVDRVRAWTLALAKLVAAVPEARCLVVKYEDLDREKTVRGIWDFIFAGGQEWNTARWRQLDVLNVQTMPGKIVLKPENWERLRAAKG